MKIIEKCEMDAGTDRDNTQNSVKYACKVYWIHPSSRERIKRIYNWFNNQLMKAKGKKDLLWNKCRGHQSEKGLW